MYFHCQTNLVATFRELYPTELQFEGNRSIRFARGAALPLDALRHCIALALTYHLDRAPERRRSDVDDGNGLDRRRHQAAHPHLVVSARALGLSPRRGTRSNLGRCRGRPVAPAHLRRSSAAAGAGCGSKCAARRAAMRLRAIGRSVRTRHPRNAAGRRTRSRPHSIRYSISAAAAAVRWCGSRTSPQRPH